MFLKNGDAIFGTRPWVRFGDTLPSGVGEVRHTRKNGNLYIIVTRLTARQQQACDSERAERGTLTLLSTGEVQRVERSAENAPFVTLPSGVLANTIAVIKVQFP